MLQRFTKCSLGIMEYTDKVYHGIVDYMLAQDLVVWSLCTTEYKNKDKISVLWYNEDGEMVTLRLLGFRLDPHNNLYFIATDKDDDFEFTDRQLGVARTEEFSDYSGAVYGSHYYAQYSLLNIAGVLDEYVKITRKTFIEDVKQQLKQKSIYSSDGRFVFEYINSCYYGLATRVKEEYGLDCTNDDDKIVEFLRKCYDILEPEFC